MNNNFKQELQEREFLALKDKHRVILKWATGCGKSKMAIDLLNNVKCEPVLLVVGERAHKDNWKKEFIKWIKYGLALHIVCYNSLHKVKDISFGAVILDEAHHCFTEKRMAALEELKENLMPNAYIYLLSATLSSGKQDMVESIFGKFTVSTVTLKEAISNDILPDPKVYVVDMELDNTHPNQVIKIGKDANPPEVKWEERARYIYNNKSCIIRCTEFQKNAYYTSLMEYWKQRYERSHNQYHHTMWVNTGSQRKRFLGELKTAAIKRLIDSLPKKKRFVCFCASVNQANMLDYVNTISSKRPAKSNQLIIDKFNAKKIDHIYAVGMITEGMNLTDIQLGIIVQLDGKERLFIQKLGRSLRAEDPVTFIFYYKGTQDEVYLKGALDNIDSKYVQHININQLNNIKL